MSCLLLFLFSATRSGGATGNIRARFENMAKQEEVIFVKMYVYDLDVCTL